MALAVLARVGRAPLEAGQAAFFKGSPCDKECVAQIIARIGAANALFPSAKSGGKEPE